MAKPGTQRPASSPATIAAAIHTGRSLSGVDKRGGASIVVTR
ncbi:hypothetical protein [Amycolatopsis eburnea]|nr:hypothetical protein [Amycolatopsis eburnea]